MTRLKLRQYSDVLECGLAIVLLLMIAVAADVARDKIEPPAALDVTRDTPLGVIESGGDITAALQWACSHAHQHRRAIAIPGGRWRVSETIDTPFRSGLVLTGNGVMDPKCNETMQGSGTVLEWAGRPGGVLLRYCGRDGELGGFAIDGGGKLGVGVLIEKTREGLGTGKAIFRPIYLYRMATGVQLGTSTKMNNCDLCTFERIEADQVEVVYRQTTEQAMDNRIERLVVRRCPVGLWLEGGNLVVEQSLANQPGTTLCRVPPSKGFGPNNGAIVLRGTKVDHQALKGFRLIDSDNPSMVAFQVEGGQMPSGYEGTLVRLCGANSLVCDKFRSSYAVIEGKQHPGWGTPTVLIDRAMLLTWQEPASWFTGDLQASVVRCWTSTGKRVEWDSQVLPVPDVEPDWGREINRLDSRIDGIKLEVPQ